jgi:hypothetical protein
LTQDSEIIGYFRNLALKTDATKECLMARRGDRFYGSAFLVVAVLAIDLAGCASIPYDQRDPSARTYYVRSPGGFGSTPLGRQVDWTWQHHTVRDNPSFIRDNEICNAASKTNTATMMFGGDPPIRLYEDCMARLGYQLIEKRASGDPVSRGWGRGIE